MAVNHSLGYMLLSSVRRREKTCHCIIRREHLGLTDGTKGMLCGTGAGVDTWSSFRMEGGGADVG